MSARIVLATAELDPLCALLGIELPAVLAGDVDGPPAADVRSGLAARGLLDGSAPAAPLASALRRLAEAPLALELHRAPRAPLAAVAALDSRRATLAVRRGDRVSLREMGPDGAPAALLALLGPLRPACGHPVRVPVDVLTGALADAGDDPRRLAVELMRRGMSGTSARSLVAANRDVDARTGIGATVRATAGARPGPHRLSVQHNAAGHHLQRPCPGAGELLECAPATPERLARGLDDLVRAAADGP